MAFHFRSFSVSVLSMNTRTASGSRSALSNNRFSTRVDEQLAFIDRVCDLLIKSRSIDGYSYFPLSEVVATAGGEDVLPRSTCCPDARMFTLQDLATDLDIDSIGDHKFTPPQTVRSAELVDGCVSSAKPECGVDLRGTYAIPALLVDSAKPRGSPAV